MKIFGRLLLQRDLEIKNQSSVRSFTNQILLFFSFWTFPNCKNSWRSFSLSTRAWFMDEAPCWCSLLRDTLIISLVYVLLSSHNPCRRSSKADSYATNLVFLLTNNYKSTLLQALTFGHRLSCLDSFLDSIMKIWSFQQCTECSPNIWGTSGKARK